MANFNLAGQKIKDTYTQVAQVNGTRLVNGSGTATPIATSSIVNFPTEVSRSAAAAGFGSGGGGVSEATFTAYTSSNDNKVDALIAATSSYLTSLPSGVVSSSAQVNLSQATGTAANATSASHAELADYATSAGEASSANQATLVLMTGTSTNSTYRVVFASSNGYQGARIDTEALAFYYNPATNALAGLNSVTSTNFYGNATTATTASHAIAARSSSYARNALSASYAPSTPPGLVSGTGANSMKNADSLTLSPAIASGDISIALGQAAQASGSDSIAIGRDSTSGNNAISIGVVSNAPAQDSIAIGKGADATQQGTVAIGLDTNATSTNTVAIGDTARAESNGAISIGAESYAHSPYSVAIGYQAQDSDANREGSVQIGYDTAAAQYGIGLGYRTEGNGDSAIGIGSEARGNANYTIAIGRQATSFQQNAIIIGDQLTATVQSEINIGNVFRYNSGSADEKAKINAKALNLPPQATLPSGVLGDLAVSGSGLYFHNGSTWSLIS